MRYLTDRKRATGMGSAKSGTAHFWAMKVSAVGLLVLIPLFVVVFFLPFWWARPAAAIIFSLAGITDWLDGYYARKLGLTSSFGAFLDPVADKLMVAVALLLLVQSEPTPALAIPAAVIIGREITISALREWMAELGKSATVSVSMMGKIKTTAQMFAIIFLLHRDDWIGIPTYEVGLTLLVIAAGLTLLSMFIYLKASWQEMKAGS